MKTAPVLERMRAALDAELARFGDLGARTEAGLIAEGIIADVFATGDAPPAGALPPSQQPDVYHTRPAPGEG